MPAAAIENQYRIATSAAGLMQRADRGLIAITGKDRAAWLHNLVTHAIKTLPAGDGNYAFATNVKGRTIFDGNLLVLADRIWLDLDRRWLDAAMKHLSRYVITEEVSLAEQTAQWARFSLAGPAADEVIGRLGIASLSQMAQLQHVEFGWHGAAGRLARNDAWVGLPTAELWIESGGGAALEAALLDAGRGAGLARIEAPTVEILRIEAGIPASLSDIDDQVIPSETLQAERGISYHKGCYLGQEVLERMRSHGVLARRLVGLSLSGEPAEGTLPATISVAGSESGRLTSCCWSFARAGWVGLGILKSAHSADGQEVEIRAGDALITGRIISLPMRSSGAADGGKMD
ncbi:MAG: glycine cleavage T C-terminal barrel domain-containing protein [Phycisphaerae bacterium]